MAENADERSCAGEQLKPLEHSRLKGAGINIPSAPFELDPDWEVDPESLHIEEKIGVCSHWLPFGSHIITAALHF